MKCYNDLKEQVNGLRGQDIDNILSNVDEYFKYFDSSDNNLKTAKDLIEKDTIQTITTLQTDKRNIVSEINNLLKNAKNKNTKQTLLSYQKNLWL